jgi:hypothetical protein
MPVERVKITPDRIIAKNTCSGVVFDTCNQYVRTDNTCSFVYDVAVSAPRPSSRSSMGECSGVILMHDYHSLCSGMCYAGSYPQNCKAFSCNFSFTTSGWMTVEQTLYSTSTGTLYGGGSLSSQCPFFVLDVWFCCFHPNCNCLEKVYCYAPGLMSINEGQSGSGINYFAADPRSPLPNLNPTPQGGYVCYGTQFGCCAWWYVGCGACNWSAGAHQFGCGFWCTKKCGVQNQFYIRNGEYSKTCVHIYRCWYHNMKGYGMSGHLPAWCFSQSVFECLPVSIDFCSSKCLPLEITD